MEHHKSLPTLNYFTAVDDNHLKNDARASSLQSIETALILISMDKWPTVITLLWEASEKLLKTIVGKKHTDKKTERSQNTAQRLINRYAEKYQHPVLYKTRLENFRDERNAFSHHGYSPDDDIRIVKVVFEDAIPLLDDIFKIIFGKSIFEIIRSTVGQEWIADTYQATSKAIAKKKNMENPNLLPALVPLQLIFERIHRTGHANEIFTETTNLEHLLAEEFQDIAYGLKRRLYFDFIAEMEDSIKHIVYNQLQTIPGQSCLRCQGEKIIGAVTFDKYGEFVKVSAYACYHCEWKIWDQEVCDVFVNDVLTAKQISILNNKEIASASESPPLTI
jgi:hypothetical protein